MRAKTIKVLRLSVERFLNRLHGELIHHPSNLFPLHFNVHFMQIDKAINLQLQLPPRRRQRKNRFWILGEYDP